MMGFCDNVIRAYLGLALLGGLLTVAGCGASAGDQALVERPAVARQAIITTAPGYITAFAGTGTRGFSASGTAALSSQLDTPSGMAIAPDGALFVSDTGNNRIVKFSGGTMTVVVAGQTAAGGVPYSNLLANPGGETPVTTAGQIPGWTIVSPTPGGWEELLTVPDRPEPLDGEHFFCATVSATAEMYQEVGVGAYATAIDAGTQQFAFSGFVHSIISDGAAGDAAQIIVEFRNAAGTVLSTASSPTYNSGQQVVWQEWKLLTNTRTAPVGTRLIRVRLLSTRHGGQGNDAYYDGLFLRALPATNVGDNGQAINATLAAPHGLAFGTDGALYIADTYNHRIRKVASPVSGTAMITTVAGTGVLDVYSGGPAVGSPLALPMSVAPNPDAPGFFIADTLHHVIEQVLSDGSSFLLDGTISSTVGGVPPSYSYPWALVDVKSVGSIARNPLLVADRSNNILRNVPFGESPGGTFPVDILTAGRGFQDVLEPAMTGGPFGLYFRPISLAASPPTGSRFNAHVFVGDLSNHRVRHYSDGATQTVVGTGAIGNDGDNGAGYQATISAPAALAVDSSGTLYICDAENNRIRALHCAIADRCTNDVSFNTTTQQCVSTPTRFTVNDGNPCTYDRCYWADGAVIHPAMSTVQSGTVYCDDGNLCNGTETCVGTTCTSPARRRSSKRLLRQEGSPVGRGR